MSTAPAATPTGPQGARTFAVLWSGQLISQLGSALTDFAFGVWVYQQTGSATQFGLLVFLAWLPGVLALPFAGVLVDRWDRRRTLLLSDAGGALTRVVALALLLSGRLEVWHLYPLAALSSTFTALQQPAFSATVPLLVPAHQLGRYAGISQLLVAVPQVLSPLLGAALLAGFGLGAVLWLDLGSFLCALATLLAVRLPRPAASAAGRAAAGGGLRRQALFGLRYVRRRPGLLALALLFLVNNFATSMTRVLLTPLLLSFGTVTQMGTVTSLAGLGFVAGALVMSAWGGPRRRVHGILAVIALQAAALWLGAIQPSLPRLGLMAFLLMLSLPLASGCSEAIWQSRVPPELMGRVFAARKLIAFSSMPVAYLLGGILADRVFEPLMASGSALATAASHLAGTGPGSGMALLVLLLGVVLAGNAACGWRHRALRRLDRERVGSGPQARRTR